MDMINLHDIVYDRSLNPRLHGVDDDVVEFYASIFREVVWPPLLVDRASNKLLDGWHRVAAAKLAGVYSFAVQWIDAEEHELFAWAVKANLGHGMHLKKEERLKAIARLQRDSWNNDRIKEFLGCTAAMVKNTEKAEDLRIKYKVANSPAALLPTETLVEVNRLPIEYQDDIVELACELQAAPADVRRTVRAIKKGEVENPIEIRKTMADSEYLKARRAAQLPALAEGNWLMTFAALADQLEKSQIAINPMEREAAITLFQRMRSWADHHLMLLG